MRIQNLKAIQPKSFVPKTTDSNRNFGRNANLLLNRAPPIQPNEVFVGEITGRPLISLYPMYLFFIWPLGELLVPLDMSSRMTVSWDLDDSMRSGLVINALVKSIERRNLKNGLIIHTDGEIGSMRQKTLGS